MSIKRSSRPQDISWFLDAKANGQLNLEPPYQRKSVWTPKDRRYFLDTIFHNYPSPAIFLHKEIIDGKTIYNVVDGKQRLESIFNYAEDKIALGKELGDSSLDGKKWSQIPDERKQDFWNYVLPVELIDFTDSATLTEAFNRLNRNSRKLERQEIRHSQYDGWFIEFVEKEAEDPVWKTLCITTTARVRRMKDYQFLSELALVVIEGNIHGFDQDLLDEKYAQYNDLDEAGLLQQEQAIRDKFAVAKQFILDLEATHDCVSQYATTVTAFYTLWSWVVLHRDVTKHTTTYIGGLFNGFMKEVALATKDAQRNTAPAPYNIKDILEYVASSKGASTDLAQRASRLEVLNRVLA